MIKREAELKSLLWRELKHRLPHFVQLQYATAGAPDREIVGNNVASHWEMKHGTPSFDSPGNQELLCMRLASQGHCRYVIWQERQGEELTLIVHPNAIHSRVGWHLEAEARCAGFDIGWLVGQIQLVHGLKTVLPF